MLTYIGKQAFTLLRPTIYSTNSIEFDNTKKFKAGFQIGKPVQVDKNYCTDNLRFFIRFFGVLVLFGQQRKSF
jgi:hypothetical protein